MPGGPRKTTLSRGGDEIQCSEVGDGVAFEAAGMVEVELLQRFSRREPGGADATLTAVGFSCRYFALQARRQVFLVAPVLGPGPFGQPGRGLAQRRGLERPGQVGRSRRTRHALRRVVLVAIRPPRRRGRHPTRCRSRRGTDRHVGLGGPAAACDRVAPQHFRRLHMVGIRDRLMRRPRSAHGRRPVWPSQNACTRSRSARTTTRRPILAGCTE